MGEIDRLSLIVDELLILSRAGEHELPGTEIELARMPWSRAVERWRDLAREREIALEVDGRRRGRRRLVCGPRPRPLDRLPGRERVALLTRRLDGDDRGRRRADRDPRRGPRIGARRGGGRLRPLPAGQRGAPRARRDRTRSLDRPRADSAVGWRGHPCGAGGRRGSGDDLIRPAADRVNLDDFAEPLPELLYVCLDENAGDHSLGGPGAPRRVDRGGRLDCRRQPCEPTDRPRLRTDLRRRLPGAAGGGAINSRDGASAPRDADAHGTGIPDAACCDTPAG